MSFSWYFQMPFIEIENNISLKLQIICPKCTVFACGRAGWSLMIDLYLHWTDQDISLSTPTIVILFMGLENGVINDHTYLLLLNWIHLTGFVMNFKKNWHWSCSNPKTLPNPYSVLFYWCKARHGLEPNTTYCRPDLSEI